jgi:hypothetical protein
VLPHPLLPLQPPAGLRARIFATLHALDEEVKAATPALEPLIPPVALKHQILGKLATLGDTSEPIPAPVRSTLHRREPRLGKAGTAPHPSLRKERSPSSLRHRPRWSFSVEQALSFTHALASGAALILLVLLCISTVRLVRTQEQVASMQQAMQEARKRTELVRRATERTHEQLFELEALVQQRQQAQRREQESLAEFRSAYTQLWHSTEDLRRGLQEAEREQRSVELQTKQSTQQVVVAHQASLEAHRNAEVLQQELAHSRERSTNLEGTLSVMVTNLK